MQLVLVNEFPQVLSGESSRELCAPRRVSWAQAGNPGVSDWALPPYPQRHRHLLTKKKKKKKKFVVTCRLERTTTSPWSNRAMAAGLLAKCGRKGAYVHSASWLADPLGGRAGTCPLLYHFDAVRCRTISLPLSIRPRIIFSFLSLGYFLGFLYIVFKLPMSQPSGCVFCV